LLAALVLSLVSGPAQVAAQSEDETGVSGNSYVSPTFGYSLEWDRTWDVSDELVESDYNMLRLEDSSSFITFEGYDFPTDPAECVETVIGTLENLDGLTGLDAADAEASAPESAASELTFALEDDNGEEIEYSGYIECRLINDGEATLSISHYGLTDGWDEASEGREDILASLETDGAAAPDDESDEPADEPEEVDTSDTDSLLQDVEGDGDVPNNIDEIMVLFQASINDIVLYWERQYPIVSGGEDFVPPTFVPYVGELDTACGPITGWDNDLGYGTGPVQCGGDDTIYLDVHFVEFQYEAVGGEIPFLVTSVVAHEVGHHVQDLLGMEACYETPCLDPNQLTGLEIEYMADCFAGAWSADAQLRGRLGARDVDLAIVQWATTLGGGTESADWGSHGTGSERTWWFLNGYVEGAAKCFETSDVTRNWLSTDTQTEETPEATEETPAEPTEETTEETPDNGNTGGSVAIGDAFETSQGSLTATGTEVETSIDTRDADGQFVIVYVEYEPAADGPYDYSGWTVVDSNGEVYELDERATDLLLSSAYPDGTDEELESGAGYGIAFVFDVPADASELTLTNDDEGVSITLDI
jgi:predicted metalloprotease